MSNTKERRAPLSGSHDPGSGVTRVACLTRISTDEVNQPYSLDAQANGLDAFVSSQPGFEITHRFVDQASGATLERPGLQAALAAARAGAFDVLLVYRIDRLSRSITGLMEIVAELDRVGVALKSATEPIDTQGPVGRMLLQLLGIFAEFERGVLIDRITKGFERKAARGEWLTGAAPFGYRLDSTIKSLVPDEAEAAVVREMFTAYVEEGLGGKAIANKLNDSGRTTRSGKPWTNQTIFRLLRNPVYIGKIAHGSDVHDGKHDGIIDEEVFARVNELLVERAAVSATLIPSLSTYTLASRTRCTVCHGAYVGAGAHNKSRFYRYYICRKRQIAGAYGCRGFRVPADDIEDEVFDQLVEYFAAYQIVEEAAAAALVAVNDEEPRLRAELASTEAELKTTTKALNRYLHAFESGSMPAEKCAPRVDELSDRCERLTAHRDRLGTQLNKALQPKLPTREQLVALHAELARILREGSPDVKKKVVEEFVDHVDITPEREVTPYFRLPDLNRAGPILASVCSRTEVRMGPTNVGAEGLEPPTCSL